MRPSGVVLIGAPGAGCSSVGRALADATGMPLLDLGQETAAALGTAPELALVAVPEERYRRTERATARWALAQAAGGAVIALGSGCLSDDGVRTALTRARAEGACLVHLTATPRRLATRNGLDAPRSVALGNVHQAFTRMLREREEACARVGAEVVDTTDTTPAQAAAAILDLERSARGALDRGTDDA
ncbi:MULTISPECIES: shikimate kinase [unclassified Actinomyces]|uniref:shikimate kinase n=1 Tax=unclassified Actinomyces TaxID=2609248 RepID=UPI0013A68C2D|nr:shikimate kinase [Actinomyces sp. 594]MBW3070222.1 shikimate kinase [Actinomyces sp. 594]NDR52710.1 shikimate kinase [Actinomyces sp. 565]